MSASNHAQHGYTRRTGTSRDEPKIDGRRSNATPRVRGDLEQNLRRRRRPARSPHLCEHLLVVELLAELFAICTRYVPRDAQRVRTPDDLPPALERIALGAERSARTWLAWTAEPRTWFLVAERAKVSEPACRGLAIRLFFYDQDGKPVASGTWVMNESRRWTLVNPR